MVNPPRTLELGKLKPTDFLGIVIQQSLISCRPRKPVFRDILSDHPELRIRSMCDLAQFGAWSESARSNPSPALTPGGTHSATIRVRSCRYSPCLDISLPEQLSVGNFCGARQKRKELDKLHHYRGQKQVQAISS